MTSEYDDLDDLKAAFATATPPPDAAVKAAHLALAQENFDSRLGSGQGSRQSARLNPERPKRGVFQGVIDMLNIISTKGGLTMTTALVAVGFLALSPQGQSLWRNGAPVIGEGDVQLTPDTDALVTDTSVANADAPLTDQATGAPEVVVTEQAVVGSPEPAQTTAPVTTAPATTSPVTAAPETVVRDQVATENNPADSEAVDGAVGGAVQELDAQASAGLIEVAPPAPAAEMALSGAISDDLGRLAAPMDGTFAIQQGYADTRIIPDPNTEAFATAEVNPLKITAEEPVSTFSIDVDTASYAVIRQSLNAGQLPPPDAVRIEEMINYFPYAYAAPDASDAPFQPTVSVMTTPWNPDTQLISIGLQGEMPAIADREPLNLVFLIDTSGSMDEPAKLPLLKQSFRLMLDNLRPNDQVAIVTYAGSAGLVLQSTPASDRQTILQAIQNLGAGGSTNGQGGLEQAYAVAETMAENNEVSRIILATDGDFNVGLSGTQELTDYIADKRDSGVYLSVLGFGRGNLDDATMQALAQNGNGTAAYIDTLSEAQKVLVDQLTGALFPIAGDVKVQVEFNPAAVAEYRLIGYETRALNREDFNNDAVDAGELGAGHTVTAIYEVTPVGSPAQLSDPLRYGDPVAAAAPADELAFLKLRWKEPGATTSQLMTTPITVTGAVAGTEAQFAAAIAGFGQLLRGESYLGNWGYDDAIALANANRGEDAFGYRNEAVQLMRLAQSLSAN